MLLKHYRTISWMLEYFPDTIAEELDRPFEGIDELVDHIDVEMSMNNRKLESRMAGIQKSRLLLDRVNEALTVLKKKPNDGEKLYNLIYETYIAPEKLSLTDILYRLDMSPRHYYRLRELGVRELMTAFDMDYLTNPNVQKAFADLSSLLGEIGIPFGTYLWNPEYKGLDDYMHAFLMRFNKSE